MAFLFTHVPLILYAVFRTPRIFPSSPRGCPPNLSSASQEMGWLGVGALLLRAYSMGAGTYTGIEAVSNSMQTLREPRVQTGKRAMAYLAFSSPSWRAGSSSGTS